MRTAYVAHAGRVFALQSAQIAARKQRLGQHLLVIHGSRDGHRFIEGGHGVRIVAGGFQCLAPAGQHPGAQTLALRLGEQGSRRVDLLLSGGAVALRVVIAE